MAGTFSLMSPYLLGKYDTQWKQGEENEFISIANICWLWAHLAATVSFLHIGSFDAHPHTIIIPISHQLKAISWLGGEGDLHLDSLNVESIPPLGNRTLYNRLPTSCLSYAVRHLAKAGLLPPWALPFLSWVWHHVYKCHLLWVNKNKRRQQRKTISVFGSTKWKKSQLMSSKTDLIYMK